MGKRGKGEGTEKRWKKGVGLKENKEGYWRWVEEA